MTSVDLPGGQSLTYVESGSGPVVVLLHAFLMDHEMFASQVAALGDAFRLVTVDERGHGGTPADGPFDYWDVARDVLALLDVLDVERAAVLGTSQGGFVALRLALLAPERVSALVLLGTSADVQDPPAAVAYRELGQAWVANGPAEPILDTVATICLGHAPSETWREKWRAVPGERVLANITTLVDRDGLLDRLGEITCPALVLHGSADGAYPVTHAQQVVDGLKDARPLVLVEGGAHFLSYTDPDAVNPAIREFLRETAG